MKNLYILILVTLFTQVSFGQSRSINKFINHHKVQDNALAVTVPGWMMDLAAYSTRFADLDEEVRELVSFSDNIKKIRFLIIQENADVKEKDFTKLLDGLKREKFEDLMTVHSEETDVRLMVKENGETIRNITAVIKSEGNVVLLTLSGKFKYEDLKKMKMWNDVNSKVLKEI